MKAETDEILKNLGDILLQLGCDTGWIVPNTSLNTKQLNTSIANYQFLLDSMELEIISAKEKAIERDSRLKVEEPVEVTAAASDNLKTEDDHHDDNGLNIDGIDAKYHDEPGNGLADEMDFYNMNGTDNIGVYGDLDGSKLNDDVDNYGMIDQYF